MSIGENIKNIRKNKKIKQIDLASNIKKSVRMLQKYENDSVTPSFDILKDIANALGVSVEELLGLKKKVYDLTDIITQDKSNSSKESLTPKEKEKLNQTLNLMDKIETERINKINTNAAKAIVDIGLYASLDDEMEILNEATDKQIFNILNSLGKQLKFELFELKNTIEKNKKAKN